MRISQNSSAFYDVRRVIACATKIENSRIQREAFGARQCPLSANGGSLRCAGRSWRDGLCILVPAATFKFDDELLFFPVTASALLTKCKFSQCPAFAKHAEANIIASWRRSAKRDRLNNTQ